MKEKAFYLKINRNTDYAYRNLKRWVDIAMVCGGDCYIVCDKPEVEKKAKEKLVITEGIEFIPSNVSETARYISKNVANDERWARVAMALLTPFIHAAEHAYESFWNIDADDTFFCLSLDRTGELLGCAEKYAVEQKIDCFSLDMLRSFEKEWYKRPAWSFGVVYTRGGLDWIDIASKHCTDQEYQAGIKKQYGGYIDYFFTYIKQCGYLKMETFYVENLKFIHFSDDFFYDPLFSLMYHWKDKWLMMPMLYHCFGISEGRFPIGDDVVKLDINIEDSETRRALIFNSMLYERNLMWKQMGCDGQRECQVMESKKVLEAKWQRFLRNSLKMQERSNETKSMMQAKVEVVGWGTGNCFRHKFEKVRELCDITKVCDNDPVKWGKEIENGIVCISPETLAEMGNVFVIIMIDDEAGKSQIVNQLLEMGIEKYDHINHWIDYIL